MEIKPIETIYNGYRFRSRLEARWAVFFDELGVQYEYEPEGFEMASGKKYLPDFRIKFYGTRGSIGEPEDLYVEVKGRMTRSDAERIREFCDGSGDGKMIPVLVVGDIPNPEEYEAQSDNLKSYDRMDGVDIYPWNYETIDGDHFAAYPAVDSQGHFYLDGDDSNYQTMDINIIRNAFRAARQARFEHGETPRR